MSELRLTDILQIEDSPELLSLLIPGTAIPAWTAVRTSFVRTIMSALLYGTAIGSGGRVGAPHKIKRLIGAVVHNLTQAVPCADICVMVTGWGTIIRGENAFDRLGGHFVNEEPHRSVLLDEQGAWAAAGPRGGRATVFASPLNSACGVRGRFHAGSCRYVAETVVGLACDRAQRILHWRTPADTRERLIAAAARRMATVPFLIDRYERWFSERGVKLLLKEDGCFGHSAPIVFAARRAGARIAEFQHGVVSKGADAYNFAPAILNSKLYRATLPDSFLSYGAWWSAQINAPLQRIEIGNPHRSEMLVARSLMASDASEFLMLGDGVDTSAYLDLCARVAPIVARHGLRLIFRPHPFERERVKSTGLPPGCMLDPGGDIYAALERAAVVASEGSTGLFEAVGIAANVWMWETPKSRFAFPKLPFRTFRDGDELDALLGTRDAAAEDAIGRDVWKCGWRENYRGFLATELVGR